MTTDEGKETYESSIDRLHNTLELETEKRGKLKGNKLEELTDKLEARVGEAGSAGVYAATGAAGGFGIGSLVGVIPVVGQIAQLVGAGAGAGFGLYTYWRVKKRKKTKDEKPDYE